MLLLSAPVFAYALNGVLWTWQDHAIEDPFAVDADSFPDDIGTDTELTDAVDGAMAEWNAIGRDATLTSSGLTTGTPLSADGHFAIRYEDLDAYSTGGTLAFAATWTWDDTTGFDCDITFLENNDYGAIDWDAAAVPDGVQIDVQATVLHELGHCLGFDHSEDSSAVMYAYYAGSRVLAADDASGLAALYGDPCVDGDGDGYSDCTGDCDDTNAAVNPGVAELCNGADDNCDGVVDAADRTATLGDEDSVVDASWAGVANVVYTEAATMLHSWRQHIQAPADTRLVWALHVGDSKDGPWTVVRTELAYATGSEWETSPTFDQPLDAGRYYTIGVGMPADGVQAWWQSAASRKQQGPVKPQGGVSGRALGDQYEGASPTYLWHQELSLVDLPDEDEDGVTGLCGDCSPEDATVAEGLPELCDGLDNDCDAVIDEDVPDTDGDAQLDCFDPCPLDPLDDADGDGACADADPCPDDPEDTCDDTGDSGDSGDSGDTAGTGDSEDTAGTGDSEGGAGDTAADTAEKAEPGGCGCATTPSPWGAITLIAALLLRRRQR